MLIESLEKKRLISPPKWLSSNCVLLSRVGSYAYGVSNAESDFDVAGIAIPKKDMIFPHLRGEIPGFGTPGPSFDQYQQHHIVDDSALAGKGREYDITVFNIVKFFKLAMENNPNILDLLFVSNDCILHSTQVYNRIRESRDLFLHKGLWSKFRGYSFAQLHKVRNIKSDPELTPIWNFEQKHNIDQETTIEDVEEEMKVRGMNTQLKNLTDQELIQYHQLHKKLQDIGKRKQLKKTSGTDHKFLAHTVRLLLLAEQVITTGTMDLRKDNETIKAIRRGERSEADVYEFFNVKEKQLEGLLPSSPLPAKPSEARLKALLFECLEMHYGNLKDCVVQPDRYKLALDEIRATLERNNI